MTPEKELEFERKLNALCMSNARIESVLIGDEMGSIGVAQRLVNNEKRIDIAHARIEAHEMKCAEDKTKEKTQRRTLIWVFGILWTVGTFVAGILIA